MHTTEAVKTVVQCDFDGTVTEEDMGYLLLDAFARGTWRQLLTEYRAGRMSVGRFNSSAFATVTADEQALLKFVRSRVRIRAGFREMLDYCRRRDFRFTIISNGLLFYIEAILKDIGLDSIEVRAAQNRFTPRGIEAKYIGPEGKEIQDGFKEVYTRIFLSQGYRVVYIGNGLSDAPPARQSHHIFATEELLTCCREGKIDFTPFADFNDIIRGLKLLP